MKTEKQYKVLKYLDTIKGKETKLLQSLITREIVCQDTPFEVLYKDVRDGGDSWGTTYNETFYLMDLFAETSLDVKISSNKTNNIHSTKCKAPVNITQRSQENNVIYIVNCKDGIYPNYNSSLRDNRFKEIVRDFSNTDYQRDYVLQYTILKADDEPKNKEFYKQLNNGSDKVIVTFGTTAWFILDRNILLIDGNPKLKNTSFNINAKELAKIAVLFTDTLIQNYKKEELKQLIDSVPELLQTFNDSMKEKILEESVELLVQASKRGLEQFKKDTTQRIDNLVKELYGLYDALNDANLKISANETLKEDCNNSLKLVFDILDRYKKLNIINSYNILPYNETRKSLDIEITTKAVPQNYIDFERLQKVSDAFSNKIKAKIPDLVDGKLRLYTSPMRMVLIINPQSTDRPIQMVFDSNNALESNPATVNKHTTYYSTSANGLPFNYATTGCLGSFEPKLIEAQKQFHTNKNESIKKYLNLHMQYIQSTNVLDAAGQTNVEIGYYVNTKTSIIEFQCSGRNVGVNIYDL